MTRTGSVSPPDSYPCPDTVNRSQTKVHPESRKPQVPTGTAPSPSPRAELRRPPANPQKSRRHCIDFGLGRTTAQISASPPSQHVVSSASPPFGAHASAGYESDTSSLFDNLDMVFPQPPPIILRRVRSSPLLSAKGTCVVRSAMDICGDRKLHDYASSKHWSVLHNAASARHWASVGPTELLEQLELELEGEPLLSSKAPVLSPVHNHPLAARASESYNYGRRTDHVSIAVSVSELQKSLSIPSPSQTKERHNATLCASKYAHTSRNPGPSVVTDKTKTLSHARSTSSIISRTIQRERMATSTTFGPTRNVLSKARSATPVAPLDHLDPSQKKSKASHPQGLHCPTSNRIQNHQVEVKHCPSFASFACAERQKMSKRAHLSNFFAGFGSSKDSLGHLRSLGSPFHHRLTRGQPDAHTPTRAPSSHVPKSFIDITPEQDTGDPRSTRRELTRKLLVKASRGILGWGRSTTQGAKRV
jgi:hypothetical protein